MPINTIFILCTENSPSLTCYITTGLLFLHFVLPCLQVKLLPLEHRKTTVQGESKSKMPNMYELNNLLISTTQANYKTFTTPNWWQRHAWRFKAKILSGHKKKGCVGAKYAKNAHFWSLQGGCCRVCPIIVSETDLCSLHLTEDFIAMFSIRYFKIDVHKHNCIKKSIGRYQ